MWGKEYLLQRNAPVSMTPIRRFQRSSGKSTTGATYCRPALLTMMSRRPNFSTAASTRWRTSSGEETFVLTKRVLNPASLKFRLGSFPAGNVHVGNHAVRARMGERFHNRTPNPACTTRYYRNFSLHDVLLATLPSAVWLSLDSGCVPVARTRVIDSIALRSDGSAIPLHVLHVPAPLRTHGIRRNRHDTLSATSI